MSGIKFPGGSRAAKPLEQSTHKLKLNLALSLSLSQPYLAHQKWVELWRPELANTILWPFPPRPPATHENPSGGQRRRQTNMSQYVRSPPLLRIPTTAGWRGPNAALWITIWPGFSQLKQGSVWRARFILLLVAHSTLGQTYFGGERHNLPTHHLLWNSRNESNLLLPILALFFFLTILLPVCCRPALAGKLFQGWALVRVWAVWSWVAPLAGNTNTPARSLVHSLRLGTSIWSGGRQPTGSSDCRSSSLLLARVSHLRPLHFFPLGDGMRIGREKEREKKQPPPQKRKTRQDTTACETKKKKTTEFVREEPRKRIEKESIHHASLFVMETAKVERGDGRYGCVTLGRTEVWNVPKQPSVRQWRQMAFL